MYCMDSGEDSLIVAVDGGGSTCRVRLYNPSGVVLGSAQGSCANVTTDFDETRQNVLSTIRLAYTDADIATSRIPSDISCLGLAGANVGDGAQRLAESLDFARVRVVSDREITLRGALGDHDGAIAQAGTGSFFSARLNGGLRHAGGWGFQLSDDCSGAYLGRKLLRAAVAAYDGLAQNSPLTDAILDRFGGTPRKLIAFIQSATPLDYGSFAPELAAAQENGDPVANHILEDAVARMVHILDVLNAHDTGRLCLLGGVGPTYERLLPARYRDIVVAPFGSGLDGAFAIAKQEMMESGK